MNTLGTPCFFVVKAMDEAAQLIASHLSPSTATDIVETTLVSMDFEHDISAVICMDEVISRTSEALPSSTVEQQFNPLFLPNKIEDIDELLELQPHLDAVKFVGLDGNPFTIKHSNLKIDDNVVLMGRAQYHPFELPPYVDIIDAYERTSIN